MTILRDIDEGRILIFNEQEYYPQHFSTLSPGYRTAVEHGSHRCYVAGAAGKCLLSVHTVVYEYNIGTLSADYAKQVEMWHKTEVVNKGVIGASAMDRVGIVKG